MMTSIGIIEKEESVVSHVKTCLVNVKGCGIAFSCASIREYQQLPDEKKKADILLIGTVNELESLNMVAKIKRANLIRQIILMSVDSREQFVLKAIRAGVVGFLNNPFSQGGLEECLSSVIAGKSFLSSDMQKKLFDLLHRETPTHTHVISPDTLTVRENDIVRLIIKGYTNKEIGDSLFISHHTVNEHLKRVFRKLNVNSRVKLINRVVADLNLHS